MALSVVIGLVFQEVVSSVLSPVLASCEEHVIKVLSSQEGLCKG